MHDPEELPPDGLDRLVLEPGWRRTSGQGGGRLLDWRCCSAGTPRVTAARAMCQVEGALAVGVDDDMEALALTGLTRGVDDRGGLTPEPGEPVRLLFLPDATSRWAAMLAAIGATFLVLEAGKPT